MCWNKDPNQRPVSSLSLSLSLSQSSQIVFVLICETQTHILTHILKRSEMCLIQFSVHCCVPWFEIHTKQIERTLKLFVKCCNRDEVVMLSPCYLIYLCFLVEKRSIWNEILFDSKSLCSSRHFGNISFLLKQNAMICYYWSITFSFDWIHFICL
jgi:hypothetical protein